MNKYASKGGVAFYYLPCSCNRCKLLVKSSRNSGLRSKQIQMAQNTIHQGLRNHTSIQGIIFYDVFFGDLGGTKYNLNFAHQSCSISIFPYQFNINYSVCLLINTNININYFQEGLSISILYQLLKKLPYQFQYQYILSISPYDIVKITNFLSISHCYQYQC